MHRPIAAALAALCTAGCVRPSALTRNVRRISGRVAPAARAFASGTGNLVRYAGQAADDAALTARVRAALAMRQGLDGSSIHLSCADGVVRLTGTARTAAQKRLAAATARGTVGVTRVENHLSLAARH